MLSSYVILTLPLIVPSPGNEQTEALQLKHLFVTSLSTFCKWLPRMEEGVQKFRVCSGRHWESAGLTQQFTFTMRLAPQEHRAAVC